MPRQRKPKTPPPPPYVHVPVPPEPGEPVWGALPEEHYTSSFHEWSTFKHYYGHLLQNEYVLPAYQRSWKWDLDRVCEYLQSILNNDPQTPVVIWKPNRQEHAILLDGQHRLVSIGATVFDSDGNQRPLPKVRLDLVNMRWEPGEPDNRTTFGVRTLFAERHWSSCQVVFDQPNTYKSDDFKVRLIETAVRHSQTTEIPVMSCSEPDSPETRQRIAGHFLRLNRSIPFTEEELQSLVKEHK